MRTSFLIASLLLFSLPRPAPAQTAAEPAAVRLPSMEVAGQPVPGENKIIGTYGQPEWSARRPFPYFSLIGPRAVRGSRCRSST